MEPKVIESASPTMNDQDVHDAIQRALDAENPKPAGGDDYAYRSDRWHVEHVYDTWFTASKGYPPEMVKRTYTVDGKNNATIGAKSTPVTRKHVYMAKPADGAAKESDAGPFDGETEHTLVYLAEAGKRHSREDHARLRSMHDSARAIIVHANFLNPNDPDNDGDDDTKNPDESKESATPPTGEDAAARLRSIHDSAHAIAGHAVQMMGPSAPETNSYGGFFPLLQSTRESEAILQESGIDVPILEVGEAHISESKSAPDKGVFEMTIIRPGFNASGSRYYKKEAIAKAASDKLFENKKMYIDHPTAAEEKNLPERSVSRIGAVITETYLGGEGELRGKASIVNPQLKDMLSLMKEQGQLHQIGVSINATGSVTPGEIDGRKTNIVEGFSSGRSVDFVTEPGAGGRIALYESNRGDVPTIHTGKESIVDEETAKKILAELATLKESNAALATQLTESDKRAQEAEARATVQATVAAKLAAVPETDLPALAKARVARMFEHATDGARVDEVIESEKAYVKDVALALAPKAAAKGAVSGLGSRVTEGAQDVIAPIKPTDNPDLIESMTGMFGSADEAKALLRQMVG